MEASSRNQQRYCQILQGFANCQPSVQEIIVIQPRKGVRRSSSMVSANMFVIRPLLVPIPQSWLEDGRFSFLEPFLLTVALALNVLAANLLQIWRWPWMVATMVPRRLPRPEPATLGHRSRALMPPADTSGPGLGRKRALVAQQPKLTSRAMRCSSGILSSGAVAGTKVPDTVGLFKKPSRNVTLASPRPSPSLERAGRRGNPPPALKLDAANRRRRAASRQKAVARDNHDAETFLRLNSVAPGTQVFYRKEVEIFRKWCADSKPRRAFVDNCQTPGDMKKMDSSMSSYFAHLFSSGYGAGRPRFVLHGFILRHTDLDGNKSRPFPRANRIIKGSAR